MGRPVLPTAVKRLTGTVRPDRVRHNEPTPDLGEPDHSLDHLSEGARALWPEFSRLLLGMGILTMVDGPALSILCETFSEGIEARKMVRENGAVYETTTKDGSTMFRAHPAVAMAADADRRFILLCNHFGLTPAARTRVSANIGDKSSNEFDDI